jgi:hypothetical protein
MRFPAIVFFSLLRLVCWSLAAALSLDAVAAQPASESFAYPAGSQIAGQAGGTGWGGPWTGGASTLVVSPGLTYSGLPGLGNALGRTPGGAAFRQLAAPVIGSAGTSLVIQALIRSNVAGTLASQATLGNSGGGTFILGDLPQPDPQAANWGIQNANGRFYSNVPVAANATVFLVAQIDFDVSGTNDRMRLWVNPLFGQQSIATPDVDVTNANVGQFQGVFWQTQQNQVLDEIRIATITSSCTPPPNTTLVVWHPFDETSGTTAANLATGNTGIELGNPVHVSGVVGDALHFDGLDDRVDAPSSIVTNIGPASAVAACSGSFSSCRGDFSFDAWVRLDPGAPSGVMILVDKRQQIGSILRGYSWYVFSGRIGIQLADGGASPGYTNYNSPVLSPQLGDHNWHHVAVTVRRAPQLIRWYHNGVPVGQQATSPRPGTLVNASPFRIGSRTEAPPLTGWFFGDIDELEMWNRVVTPAEIRAIYLAGPFGKCK